jgi:hypothetical protein
MLKIDLAKAFDRIKWSFILNALRRKGYHGHFIKLVHACISSTCFSVNVNGETYGTSEQQEELDRVAPCHRTCLLLL